jgi:hypothetical protein
MKCNVLVQVNPILCWCRGVSKDKMICSFSNLSCCSTFNGTSVDIYFITESGDYYVFNAYTLLRGEPNRSSALHEIEKKFKKMTNFKLNFNFDWMEMKIGR